MSRTVSISKAFLVLGLLSLGATPPLLAEPAPDSGGIKARVVDSQGQPVPNVFVGFVEKSGLGKLPILTRADEAGLISLQNVGPGTYQILIRSSKFQKTRAREVQVEPGRTEFVTVVLQQMLGLEVSDEENLGTKAFLRTLADRSIILRGQPGAIGDLELGLRRPYSNAVLSVSSSPGLGMDDWISSGSSGGTITSFAVENPLGFNGTSILAGQLSAGPDSLWRLKNFLNYKLSRAHEIQVFIGYGRLSRVNPYGDPVSSPFSGDAADEVSKPLRSLTFGIEDRWSLGQRLSMEWGLELDRIRAGETHSYARPSAGLTYTPFAGTQIRLVSAVKRTTQGSLLEMPSGESVVLSDAVYISRFGDDFGFGTARYNQAILRQNLGVRDAIEVAAFQNRMNGASPPFAFSGEGAPVEVLITSQGQGDTSGYRITYERQLNDKLSAAVTYAYGNAAALGSSSGRAVQEGESLGEFVRRDDFHAVAAQVDAYIPFSRTQVTALIRFVPGPNPLLTLDSYSDRFQTSNEGVNFFVRQALPMPTGLFDFLGLDFLTPQHIEALLDIRNLTNEDAGVLHTTLGDLVLLQSPRTVSGGISLKF